MSFENIVLSMDLSLTSPGFAVLAIADDGSPIVLEVGAISTNAKHGTGRRLADIHNEIARYIKTYEPTHIVRERGFSRFPAITQALFRVVGISDYAAHVQADKDVHEIATTSVKKAVTGSGRASKEEVAEAVFRILQIENHTEYYTPRGKLIDDKTDALAVGIAYYLSEGLLAEGLIE